MVNLTHSTRAIKAKDIIRKWHLVDMNNKVLGRAIPEITKLLQGKQKTTFSPNLDSGDFVVVINARTVKVTGKKMSDKIYTRYSGYPGGLRKISLANLLIKKPEEVIRHAASGMLPKNKLRAARLKRLFIFADDKHPYLNKFESQNPKS